MRHIEDGETGFGDGGMDLEFRGRDVEAIAESTPRIGYLAVQGLPPEEVALGYLAAAVPVPYAGTERNTLDIPRQVRESNSFLIGLEA